MKILVPTNCPCCSSPLKLVNDQLFCTNSSCSAQLNKKLEHFCKTLKIKGLGPKSIELLGLSEISELFYLELDDLTSALGSEKTATKILAEIKQAESADLASILAAFSIPLIGDTAASKVAAVVSHIDEITDAKCKEAGLGDKATSNLIYWLTYEFPQIKEFLPFSFKSAQKPSSITNNLTVCITGKLKSYKTKAEATAALEAAGYTVVESVTKNLNYLLDEQNGTSAKRVKANSLGINVVLDINILLKKD